jgi:hypothetical protein
MTAAARPIPTCGVFLIGVALVANGRQLRSLFATG